jgi:hypothetical protein
VGNPPRGQPGDDPLIGPLPWAVDLDGTHHHVEQFGGRVELPESFPERKNVVDVPEDVLGHEGGRRGDAQHLDGSEELLLLHLVTAELVLHARSSCVHVALSAGGHSTGDVAAGGGVPLR